jgi:hypothetical protein
MRRISPVDLMLLGTVLLWALNVTVTKYVLDHGFHPWGTRSSATGPPPLSSSASRTGASGRSASPAPT